VEGYRRGVRFDFAETIKFFPPLLNRRGLGHFCDETHPVQPHTKIAVSAKRRRSLVSYDAGLTTLLVGYVSWLAGQISAEGLG